jgi:glycosyltransferase involved in cell wall biosynthesis
MIAPTPFFADRGCHVHIYEEARHLRQMGYEITICTYHLGRNIGGFDIRRIRNIPWYRKLEAGPSPHKFYLDALLLLLCLRTARSVRPDVIHAHLHEGCAIGAVMRRLTGLPVLFDYQGSLTGELSHHKFVKRGSALWRIFRSAERRIDHAAQAVLVPSESMASEVIEDFGVPGTRVHVAMDAVDTESFSPRPADPALRRELGIPPGRKVVVFLGMLTQYQGVDHLLRAARTVIGRVPDTHFLVMGYPRVEHYQAMAAELGISQHVTFPGRIDYSRAADYLALGDVAVSAKISETEGDGKLYNYMAMGLPVVAFDRPLSQDVLGDLGFLAALGDGDALARQLLRALADEDEARSRGAAVRAKAVREHSWEAVANVIDGAYRMLLPAGRVADDAAGAGEQAVPGSQAQR